MDRRNLKLRNFAWYARLKVPKALRPILKKSELVRALHTRDLREANRLKHAVLAQMHAELLRAENQSVLPTESARQLAVTARALAEAVSNRHATPREADLAQQMLLREHVQQLAPQAEATGIAPETIIENTLAAARRYLNAGPIERLSKAIAMYLAEKAAHITKQTHDEKKRHLEDFARWVGDDREVANITRRKAGRYLTEVLMKRGHSPKTTRDTIGDLSAFWNVLKERGAVEQNVWSGMGRTVPESTRGKAPKRRPWTDEEVLRIFQGIATTDPLWALAAIGAYTGMRREEIALLRCEDVDPDDALVVREGKTAAAVRRVPIHPVIRPLIARLKERSPDGYLIPGLLTGGRDGRRSHYVGKRFTDVRRTLGLGGDDTVFHSFRKSMAQRFENVQVLPTTVELIGGWSRGERMSYGVYSPGPRFEILQREMVKLTYGEEVDALVRKLGATVAITMFSKRSGRVVNQARRKRPLAPVASSDDAKEHT